MAIGQKKKGGFLGIIILLSFVTAAAGAGFVLLNENVGTPAAPEAQGSPRESSLQEVVDLLVSVQNIQVGEELKPVQFRKETRSKRDFEEANLVVNFEQLRGVYAKSFIPAGQPLVAEYLTAKPPINSIVPKIQPDYRAITVALDKQTTNEGWARAGVRVDVMLISGQGAQSVGTLIAQNLRVLSSGASVDSAFGGVSQMVQDGQSTVTLEVSVEDQKRLKLAAGQGKLRLLLRGDEDIADVAEKIAMPLPHEVPAPQETASQKPSDQGWVVIDGRKYRVAGARLLPE